MFHFRRRNGFALIALSFVIFLIAGEVGSRILYVYITPSQGRAAVETIMKGKLESNDLGIQPHPYILYINKPDWSYKGFEQHNSLGHRGPEIEPEPEEGTVRILILGGSTTYGWLVDDPKEAWPAQLENILSRRTNRTVEVINAGLNHGTSAELLSQYMYRDRFLGADVVVFHGGGNDVGPMLFDEYFPDYRNYRAWEASEVADRPLEPTILKSHFVRVFYSWWLRGAKLIGFRSAISPITWIPSEEAIRNVKKNQPIGFRRNVEALVRNVIEDGALPVLFPFYLAEKEYLEVVGPSHDYLKDQYDATKIGVEKNTSVLEDIAGKSGEVVMIQLPEGVIPLEYFFDQCHLKPEGQQLKARYVADHLRSLIDHMD